MEYSESSSLWARAVLVSNKNGVSSPVLMPNKRYTLMNLLGSLNDLKEDHNILVDISRQDVLNAVLEEIDNFDTKRVTYLLRMFKGPNGKEAQFSRSSAIEIVRRSWHSGSHICLAFTSDAHCNETSYTMKQVELVREIEKTVFRNYTYFIELDSYLFSQTPVDILKEFAALIPIIILASDKGKRETAVDVPKLRYNVERVGVQRFLFDISRKLFDSIGIVEFSGAKRISERALLTLGFSTIFVAILLKHL